MVTVSLGTATFHRGVYWENEFDTPQKAEEEFWDIDNSYCVQEFANTPAGQEIIITAIGSDTGGQSFFTRAQIEYIESLEKSGAHVLFTYGTKSMTVRVPAKPFSITPLRKMAGHLPDDIYYGSISLRRV